MDKMTAVTKLADLRRALSKAKRYDNCVNEGGEGYESADTIHAAISALLSEIAASKLCFCADKIFDAADWMIVRLAWNDAIKANTGKSQQDILSAAQSATGYNFGQISHLKSFFA